MALADIKEDSLKFAYVISKTLDVDVLIVDNNLKTVSNTCRYFDQYTLIRRASMIGQVISSGEVLAVDDKSNFNACKECPDFVGCEMTGFVGVPIFYDNTVAGAISLVLPKQRVPKVFKDIRNSIEFLQNMADLLANKLRNNDEYNTLNVIRREREVLMDSIEDAIVSTDDLGYISYYNQQFSRYFLLEEDCRGRFIKEVLPHRLINEFLEQQEEVKNQLILLDCGGKFFYGFISCNLIRINGNLNGMLFLFKALSNISSELNEIGINRPLVSFRWAQNWLFPPPVVTEAKRLAVTGDTLLLIGESGLGKDALAKCIHKFSDRNKSAMLTMNSNRVFRELQEQSLFGELGKLQLAHKSTLYINHVEQMSFKLQSRLACFLKDPQLRLPDGREVLLDVRIIFSSSADLGRMAQEGGFSDELYYRISQHTLSLQPLRNNHVQLRRIVENAFQYYKEQHKKTHILIEVEVIEQLCRYHWPGNIRQAEDMIDQLVWQCDDRITLQHLEQLHLFDSDIEQPQSIDEMERARIAALLKTKRSKNEIARILGIGRATLYRKIKIYHLKGD